MDSFKKYLLENKNKLHVEEPGEHIWFGIKSRITKPGRRTIIARLLKWSAAACFIILAGIGLYTLIKTPEKPTENRRDSSSADRTPIKDSLKIIPTESRKDRITAAVAHLPKKKIRRLIKSEISTTKQMDNLILPGKFIDQPLISFVAALENQKTIISSTPVFGVGQDYFKEYVIKYKNLGQEEQRIKDRTRASGINSEILDEMIQIRKRRIEILILLKAEIDKVNDINKGKAMEKTYINII